MRYKQPKDTETLHWTKHALEKMRFYGLSEARVKRVLESPERREEGIAENTVACMQPTGSTKHPTEIWVMVTEKKGKRRLVSAWRYPGRTKPRDPVPIPDDF
ncbi:hypothetical protein HY624_02305 [Candidatus Uhrbacteria bacterium]|nr:hypothetical protein [Candidatus Uhrbacteria bacterium]